MLLSHHQQSESKQKYIHIAHFTDRCHNNEFSLCFQLYLLESLTFVLNIVFDESLFLQCSDFCPSTSKTKATNPSASVVFSATGICKTKRWQHFPWCFKSHQVQSEKWRTIFFCLHIIYTSGPSWHIWVFAFLPHCLSERRNTLLIGRLTSSRSACSTAHPLSVDYCGNISPVEYLLSPLDWFSVYSDLKILSLPSHHIVT